MTAKAKKAALLSSAAAIGATEKTPANVPAEVTTTDEFNPKNLVGATEKTPADALAGVTTTDEFNLKNLVLSQDFVESAGVKRLLTTVPVRKPEPRFLPCAPAAELSCRCRADRTAGRP